MPIFSDLPTRPAIGDADRTMQAGEVPVKPRFAVISLNPSPPAPVATRSTLAALKEVFPDYEMDVIYVTDQIGRSPLTLATAAAVASVTNAPGLLRRRKLLKRAIFRTPYIFRWIRRRLAREITPAAYKFSIQIQSLFDASVPGLPHFVYTDHVHLENLKFKGFGSSDLYSRAWIDCEREIYRNAATIFTWSSNVSRALVEDYGIEATRVERVNAGSNAAVPEARPVEAERYARKKILFVGSDWKRKGGPMLLEAFRAVRIRHPDATLTLVGEGPETIDIPGVEHVGRIPLAALPVYYADASIFCMPTSREPFGSVFVEAMWQQLPIVATRVGALPDIVEDGVNGFLVPPGAADRLAEHLSTLLDDPHLCATMGQAARDRAESGYDWPAVARRIRRRIEAELAARGRGAPEAGE